MKNSITLLAVFALTISISFAQSLFGKRICIDPGHGGTATTDAYRVGMTGEREEWINLRVGLLLKELLEQAGAEVLMTRDLDVEVDLATRARMAKEFNSDLFISIHHNATADTSANFPIIYFHGSAKQNTASVNFSKLLVKEFWKQMYPKRMKNYSIVSDQVIFPKGGAAVLRQTYGIPAVIAEASFFSNPAEEQRLKSVTYNKQEALAYLKAIQEFFKKKHSILEKDIDDVLQIAVNQEAARMDKSALAWKSKLEKASLIIQSRQVAAYPEAEAYLLGILKSFPDNDKIHEIYQLLLLVYKDSSRTEDYIKMKNRMEHFILHIR